MSKKEDRCTRVHRNQEKKSYKKICRLCLIQWALKKRRKSKSLEELRDDKLPRKGKIILILLLFLLKGWRRIIVKAKVKVKTNKNNKKLLIQCPLNSLASNCPKRLSSKILLPNKREDTSYPKSCLLSYHIGQSSPNSKTKSPNSKKEPINIFKDPKTNKNSNKFRTQKDISLKCHQNKSIYRKMKAIYSQIKKLSVRSYFKNQIK